MGSESPVTEGEMRALLEPLRSSMQSMEDMLRDLSFSLQPTGLKKMDTDCTTHTDLRLLANSKLTDSGLLETCFGQAGLNTRENAREKNYPGVEENSQAVFVDDATDRLGGKADSDAKRRGFSKDETGTKENGILARAYVRKQLQEARFSHNSNKPMLINQGYSDQFFFKMEKVFEWWNDLEEPKGNTYIFRLVSSRSFESVSIFAIMFNCCLVSYTLNWQIQHIGEKQPKVVNFWELGCFCFFLVELILRLWGHRWYFFLNNDMHWNIFDFVLVSISLVDVILASIVVTQTTGNVVFMRLVRLLKLARIFRSLRSFKFFKALAVLLESFQKSMNALFWGLIMLAFVLYLFALIFMQALVEYLNNHPNTDERRTMEANFGSLGRTLLSLYMSVTGGEDWSKYYRILAQTGSGYGTLFVCFTFCFIFALFNIVTATLVEKAIVSSKPDRTELILDQRRRFAEQKQELVELCEAMDTDGNGKISWKEFQDCVCNPVMLAYMASIGIAIHDVELFFDTVGARGPPCSSGLRQGEITISHFVEGCLHMKGSATAIDMQRQLFELHMLKEDVKHLDSVLMQRFRHIEQVVAQCCIASSQEKHKKRVLLSL